MFAAVAVAAAAVVVVVVVVVVAAAVVTVVTDICCSCSCFWDPLTVGRQRTSLKKCTDHSTLRVVVHRACT
jgi:hypothetical protein